jgi:hypothetical protein
MLWVAVWSDTFSSAIEFQVRDLSATKKCRSPSLNNLGNKRQFRSHQEVVPGLFAPNADYSATCGRVSSCNDGAGVGGLAEYADRRRKDLRYYEPFTW